MYLPYGQNPDLYASPEQNAREKTQRFILVCNWDLGRSLKFIANLSLTYIYQSMNLYLK